MHSSNLLLTNALEVSQCPCSIISFIFGRGDGVVRAGVARTGEQEYMISYGNITEAGRRGEV